ncbi:MAG: hypothetical protein J6J24_05085 [Clostridia bacterium]|nr:hypothetical protein [Clostridia bacterium]
MIRDRDLFIGLAEATNLSIKEGTIETRPFISVDWEDFPLRSDSYMMRIVINADLFRGGFSKPIIEFWDCEGPATKKYTLYFSNGSWKEALKFLGLEDADHHKAFRFLSEVCLLGKEEKYLGNKNEKDLDAQNKFRLLSEVYWLRREEKYLGNKNERVEILGVSNAPKVIRVDKYMGDCETFHLPHIVPTRRFDSFEALMDDTHKIYVQACANHLKADAKREKERDRG